MGWAITHTHTHTHAHADAHAHAHAHTHTRTHTHTRMQACIHTQVCVVCVCVCVCVFTTMCVCVCESMYMHWFICFSGQYEISTRAKPKSWVVKLINIRNKAQSGLSPLINSSFCRSYCKTSFCCCSFRPPKHVVHVTSNDLSENIRLSLVFSSQFRTLFPSRVNFQRPRVMKTS